MPSKVPFRTFSKRYQKWRSSTWPAVVGNTCVVFFQDSFKRQGFLNKKLDRWKARKTPDKGRGILIKRGGGGGLLGSIRVGAKTPQFVKIVAGSERIPYARIHNEGGTINHPGGAPYIIITEKGKAGPVFIRKSTASRREASGLYVKRTKPHTIKIPRRQFMGHSEALMDELEKTFFNEMDRLWRRS